MNREVHFLSPWAGRLPSAALPYSRARRGSSRRLRWATCGLVALLAGPSVSFAEDRAGKPPASHLSDPSPPVVSTNSFPPLAAPLLAPADLDEASTDPVGASPIQQTANQTSELIRLQDAKNRQFQRVQGQILELGQRWNRRSGEQPSSTSTAAAPERSPSPQPAPSNGAGAQQPPGAKRSRPQETDLPAGGATPSSTPPGQLPDSPTSAAAIPLPESDPAPLEGPVDRLGLADSLFALGQVEAAARIYSEIDLEPVTHDERIWITYQLASCDRRRGLTAAAQSKYREVIAAGNPQWLVELARWWLRTIEDRERLAANSAKLKAILQQLDTEVAHDIERINRPAADQNPPVRR